jgi:hypothetical protein
VRIHAALLTAAALAIAVSSLAQETPQRPTFALSTTGDCIDCHFAPPTATTADSFVPDGFCNREEGAVWLTRDKHRQSLYLLVSDENRPLTEQILGFPLKDVLEYELVPPDPGSPRQELVRGARFVASADAAKVTLVRQCLACHAPIEERVQANRKFTTIEYGVSCQACHGAGRTYETAHRRLAWRALKAEAKEQLFGMRDLRNPVTRIELCASCHVGSASGKFGFAGDEQTVRFVKHEWYAKGHPPLPSLEFVAFATQMPAHWRSLPEKLAGDKPFQYYSDKPAEADITDFLDNDVPRSVKIDASAFAASYLEANQASFSPEPAADLFRSKDLAISGVGVLGAYASLLANAPPALAGDFALYDCSACHHELRSQVASQSRVRRTVTAGRPPPAYWTLALARVGARQSSESSELGQELEAAIAELDQAFSARPLGDPARIKAAAQRLQQCCAKVSLSLARQPMREGEAVRLLTDLAHPKRDEDRDFHAARQHAWAIREVMADLAGLPLRIEAAAGEEAKLMHPLSPTLTALLRPEAGKEADAAHVRQRIDALFGDDAWHGPLRLRLPAGQKETIVGHQRDFLEAISSYDPQWFRERLAPIQQAFGPPK